MVETIKSNDEVTAVPSVSVAVREIEDSGSSPKEGVPVKDSETLLKATQEGRPVVVYNRADVFTAVNVPGRRVKSKTSSTLATGGDCSARGKANVGAARADLARAARRQMEESSMLQESRPA